jgi:pyruvate dehydrogenase E2 component (dihydrolipoamide acetyltransferase)
MPVSVTMPRLGESVTEGTVTRWLKQEGERVEADEPLLEVSTDKVDTEIPSPAAGVLSRIVVGEDETAEVGSELAVIAGDGEDAGSAAPAPAQEEAAEPEPEPAAPATPSTEKPVEEEAPAPQAAAESGGPAEGTEVKLPALGESVTEGTVTRWLKQVGETVEADEPLLEVSTDKVDTEIPAPVAGTLLEIKVAEDETADVGAVLAIIGTPGSAPATPAPAQPEPQEAPKQEAPKQEAPAQPAPQQRVESAPAPDVAGGSYATPTPAEETGQPEAQPASAQAAPAAPTAPASEAVQSNGAGDAGYVTPLVRKLAAEKGVDLSGLTGTGVGGRIRKQDVIDAAEKAAAAKAKTSSAPAAPAEKAAAPVEKAAKPEPSPLRGRTEKLTRIRATIARRMVESLQVSAQLTTVVEVDVTKVAQLRLKAKDAFQAKHGVKLTFLPFFALATVEALQQHPVVNSSIDVEAGTVTYHGSEHLGIAVDAPKGLVVPVIKDAGDLNLAGLSKRIADLADRTRNNKIGPDEIGGGTFTLTNTGSRGALFDTPIINQPQVGILGLGAVVKRAVIVNDPNLGEIIVPRSMVYLALSYDHRIVDGADAARFLGTIKERLEGGHFEADLGL